ncbi:hypothetical protein GOBAR_AA25137 [Gossypium barbadense]|uniref:Growth-regulating factor n=1 Tax=Gossypium barbadense TaxID=3634 RepID=A0A2P5WWQ8_GOSBA|nr:hypothetical protein GOBAR_AA25137 [Gossypium barbadense]
MISARNKYLFTPNQWQELEHQALIFKYMVSGVPIPPQLLYSVKTSFDSSLASHLFPHQPTGWGCFQVGFGRKPDPEPGRCRRTDGKKWRCSKEAYPDSKYCERHMHRGRNRSRKPVEANSSSSTAPPAPPTTAAASILSPSFPSINSNLPTSSSSLSFSPMATENFTHFDPFLYSHSSTRLHGSGLSVPSHHFLDSGTGIDYPQTDKLTGMFMEQGKVLMKDLSSPKLQRVFGDNNGSKQGQQCFVLGTDIKSAKPIKLEKDEGTQKPVHQFLGDWTQGNNNGSWLDLASNSRIVEVPIMESIKALE